MNKVWTDIKTNPVRLFAILSAGLALLAFYAPALPVPLILGLIATILGVGEGVRAKVTPTENVFIDRRELDPRS